jgi:micrococcal nuclease
MKFLAQLFILLLVFWGSINSDIYHYVSCRWAQKIHKENLIVFENKVDAHKHGYRACKVCKP